MGGGDCYRRRYISKMPAYYSWSGGFVIYWPGSTGGDRQMVAEQQVVGDDLSSSVDGGLVPRWRWDLEKAVCPVMA